MRFCSTGRGIYPVGGGIMQLDELRGGIDRIDQKLLALLNERMELALRTTRMKEEITDDTREKCVMTRVKQYSRGIVREKFASLLFTNIIAESKELQRKKPLLTAFQGEHGAYGELASRMYNTELVPLPCTSFAEVFEGVEKREFDLGIVPVENSVGGAVTEVNDLLIERNVAIVGEVLLPISHTLLVPPNTAYKEVKIVYSHPQALAQCRKYLSMNGIEPRPYCDTAGAARMIACTRPPAAGAIASTFCAQLYDLEICRENIGDSPSNVTRFVVISTDSSLKEGNKCSVVFSTLHKSGALCRVLQIFSGEGVNLTRVESRPMKNIPGQYIFLLDFQGSYRDKKIQKLLKKVEEKTILFKFLGCYPEASP
jgi:prephenate dehydratase/chorismate mutase/prephenate dehydratase